MNWTVCFDPVPHGLVDGLVPRHVGQDLRVEYARRSDLSLGLVLVETAGQETKIED